MDVVDGDRVGEGKALLGLSQEWQDEFDCIRKAMERK